MQVRLLNNWWTFFVFMFLFRAYVNKSQQNIIPLYKSFVRPHLEYAVQAWRHYTQKDIERVQIRATRMIQGLRSDSYQERLNKTGLISFEMRRLRADLIEVFKILHGMEGLPHEYFFQIHHESKNREHHFQLKKNIFALDCRKYFFSHRVVDE